MADPVIPNVPSSIPSDQLMFFTAIKASLEFMMGHGRHSEDERAARVRELRTVTTNLTDMVSNTASSSPSSDPPDPPSDMTVEKGPFVHLLKWTNPTDTNVSHIEIWVAENSQSRDDAVLSAIYTITEDLRGEPGQFPLTGFDVTKDRTYWIRSISYANNHSIWCPPDAQGGYVVPGSESVQETIDEVLGILTGKIQENQLYYALNARINKIDDPTTGLLYQMQNANGKYTVKIDYNGYVTGFGLMSYPNTGTPVSEFILLVDRFKVVTPGIVPKAPFVIGSVDGISTVGIDGNMVVDGSILARSIVAGAISVQHLDASLISAGKIKTDLLDVNSIVVSDEISGTMQFAGTGKITFGSEYKYIQGGSSGLFFRSFDSSGYTADLHLANTGSIRLETGFMGGEILIKSPGAITIQNNYANITLTSLQSIVLLANGGVIQLRSNGTDYYCDPNCFRSGGMSTRDLGTDTYRWRRGYIQEYWKNGSMIADDRDDLNLLHAVKPAKTAKTDKETGEETYIDKHDEKTGIQILDASSLPKWMTNYDELREAVRAENGDLITDDDFEEWITQEDQLGYRMLFDMGKFLDLTSGAVRQIDREYPELIDLLAARITQLERQVKELMSK